MSTPASPSEPAAEPIPTPAPSTTAPEAPVAPAPETPVVPAPEATPAPAPADQIVVPTNSEGAPDLDALTSDQRKTLLFGSDEAKSKFVFAEPKAPEAVPPVVPAAEVVPPVTPPATPPDADEVLDPTKPFPKSVRLKDLDEKTSAFVLALNTARRVNPNVNPIDVAIAHGYDLPPDFVAPPVPPTPPEPAPADPITTAKARLAEIDAEMDKVAKGESFFGEEHAKLIRERGDLAADIATQQLRAELAQSRQQDKTQADRDARISRRETVKNDVAKEYPTANDDSSELGLELNRLFTEIQSNPNHPDRAKLTADDGPRWIVQQAEKAAVARVMKNFSVPEAKALEIVKGKPAAAAEATGPAPVATPPATPKPPQPQPVPRTVLVTSPGGTNAAPDAVNLSPNDVLEAARANPKLRREALFQGSSGVTIG